MSATSTLSLDVVDDDCVNELHRALEPIPPRKGLLKRDSLGANDTLIAVGEQIDRPSTQGLTQVAASGSVRMLGRGCHRARPAKCRARAGDVRTVPEASAEAKRPDSLMSLHGRQTA